MTEKGIKNLLHSYSFINAEIKQCSQDILQLTEVIDAERQIKGIQYSDMPKGNGISDETYQKVELIMDKYNKQISIVEAKIGKLFDKKNLVENILEELDEIERKIIELKYFKKYKAWMIQSTTHYSHKQIYRIHDRAINKIINMTQNDTFSNVKCN